MPSPAIGPDGFLKETIEYDPEDRPLFFRLVSAIGEGHLERTLIARVSYAEDRVSRIDFLKQDGSLMDGAQGFSSVLYEYSKDGKVAEIVHQNAGGAIVLKTSSAMV